MSGPVKMILTGGRGVVGSAMTSWMKAHHPEVDLIHLSPFPFSLQRIADAVKDPHVRFFVNAAGFSSDVASHDTPYDCWQANVTGPMAQLEVIRRHAPHIRWLGFSTVYEETHSSPYASSKRAQSELIRSYRVNHGVYAVAARLAFTESCLRPSTVLSRKIVSGVWRIAKALKAGQSFEPIRLRDLEETFQWTWAEDVAAGVWAMLNQGERSNVSGTFRLGRVDEPITRPRDYTLSSVEPFSVRDFLELAFESVGIDDAFWDKAEPIMEHGEDVLEWVDETAKMGHRLAIETAQSILPPKPLIDMSARTDLGWSPTVSFPELVRRMMACEMEGNP